MRLGVSAGQAGARSGSLHYSQRLFTHTAVGSRELLALLLRPGTSANHLQGRSMIARIYKPAKTAMQSGVARTKEWVLEYDPEFPREIDPLMGWTSSRDMKQQVQLTFDTKEEAIAYAERSGIGYRVTEPKACAPVRKSYADNFRFGRKGSWTH